MEIELTIRTYRFTVECAHASGRPAKTGVTHFSSTIARSQGLSVIDCDGATAV
jgi:hypothetical protein